MGMTKAKRQRVLLTEIEAAQQRALKQWEEELAYRSRTLTPSTPANPTLIWDLFYQEREKARQLGLEEDLRSLCWVAAGKFANPAMLRSGMRYYKRAQ